MRPLLEECCAKCFTVKRGDPFLCFIAVSLRKCDVFHGHRVARRGEFLKRTPAAFPIPSRAQLNGQWNGPGSGDHW